MTKGGGMGGLVMQAMALRTLYSDSLSIAQQTESRKDGAAHSSVLAEDGDRNVLTSNGGCVNKGSAPSSSSSALVAALEPSDASSGWRRCMAMEAWRSVRWLHATTRGDFEQPVLSDTWRYHNNNNNLTKFTDIT